MANQYHDELGRFCSRTEMGQAVDRVFEAAASAPTEAGRKELMQQWISIKNDYDAALAKPQSYDERIKEFVNGEDYRQPTSSQDAVRMASILLTTEPVKNKAARFHELLAQVNFAELHPESRDLKNVLASKYLTDEQSYQLAKQVSAERSADAGLIALASARYGVFSKNDEREKELVRALKSSRRDDIAVTQAWVRVAGNSQWLPWREEAAQLLGDEALYYSYKPVAAYTSNPHLSLSEAVSGLQAVAAHSPRSFNTYVQGLAASTSTSLDTLHRHAELAQIATSGKSDWLADHTVGDYKSDARFATSWQLSTQELVQQRARVAELEIAGQAAADKMTGYGSPNTAFEGMTLGQQAEYGVVQARTDANDLAELRKEHRSLRGSFDGFFNRNKPYREKEELRAKYVAVGDRIRSAQHYIYQNELAARLAAEINEEAMMYRRVAAEQAAA